MLELEHEEHTGLVKIVAGLRASFLTYRDREAFIRNAGLEDFLQTLDTTGNSTTVATELIKRAINLGYDLKTRPNYHALGALLSHILTLAPAGEIESNNARFIAKLIIKYRIADDNYINQLRDQYFDTSVYNKNNIPSPICAKFVYFVGCANEFQNQNIKQHVNVYGEKGKEYEKNWIPYRYQQNRRRIVIITQEIAANENVEQQCIPLTKCIPLINVQKKDHLIKKIEAAQKKNEFIIVIIDLWTIKLPEYSKIIKECSKIIKEYEPDHFYNCTFLIIFDDNDPDNSNEKLRNELKSAFLLTGRMNYDFFIEIGSLKAFDKQLRNVLRKMWDKIREYAKPQRRATRNGQGQHSVESKKSTAPQDSAPQKTKNGVMQKPLQKPLFENGLNPTDNKQQQKSRTHTQSKRLARSNDYNGGGYTMPLF